MKKWSILLLSLLLSNPAIAAVGFDAGTPSGVAAADCSTGVSRNWTHEGGGAGTTALVVAGGDLAISSVTFNGVSLTVFNIQDDVRSMWAVATTTFIAASGTVTVNSANDVFCGGSITFTGTGTTFASLIGGTSTLASASAANYSISATTTAVDSMNFDVITKGNAADITATGNNQTLRITDDHSGGISSELSTQTATSTGVYTMSGTWTGAVSRRVMMAEIKAVAVAAVEEAVVTTVIIQ